MERSIKMAVATFTKKIYSYTYWFETFGWQDLILYSPFICTMFIYWWEHCCWLCYKHKCLVWSAGRLCKEEVVILTFHFSPFSLGPHIGTVIAMPLSGLLARHCGWPSIFYVFGKNVSILLSEPYILPEQNFNCTKTVIIPNIPNLWCTCGKHI